MPWEKNFDRDDALKAAIELFWKNGFESTSMADLLEEMGINRGSFYDTFGSKQELLIEAIGRYVVERGKDFEKAVKGKSSTDAIESFFRRCVERRVGRNNEWGCMAVNLAQEIAPRNNAVRELLLRAFDDHEKAFKSIISDGIANGELREDLDSDSVAKTMMAILFGIRVMGRSGHPPAKIKPVVDQAMSLLQ